MPVSIVLPCYNPPPGWDEVIVREYRSFLRHTGEATELVLVMDGESDAVTPGAISKIRDAIPTLKLITYSNNRGKGYATRKGVAAATGDIIIYTDVDFPYTAESICEVYGRLRSGACDVAIGIKNSEYYDKVPTARRVISKLLRALTRIFLSMPVTDTQCGLKGMRREAIDIFLSTTIDRYLFDLEFVYDCYHNPATRVEAVPVTLKENIRFRRMNYRILLPEMVNFARLLMNRKR
ncbi:MAG: glycosyltransferase family 2 protein [Taibaiella sp.]|nr:glycosyltransferase family 2 protein [Taibaiella sp.]